MAEVKEAKVQAVYGIKLDGYDVRRLLRDHEGPYKLSLEGADLEMKIKDENTFWISATMKGAPVFQTKGKIIDMEEAIRRNDIPESSPITTKVMLGGAAIEANEEGPKFAVFTGAPVIEVEWIE